MVITEPALPLVVVWLSLACIAGHVLPIIDGSSGVVIDCCSRTPAKSTPPATTAIPFSTTTAPDTHKLECEYHEQQRTACLNGGTCFALLLEGTREAFCNCPEEWKGNRCQEAEIPFVFYSTERMRTANIAAGAAVAVVIVVVILISLYVYIRWRKKQSRMENLEFEEQARNAIQDIPDGNNFEDDRESKSDLIDKETEADIHVHPTYQYNNAQSDHRNGPQKTERTAEETTV
ncbi:pro-neuregulin-1, membrane-bound isoform-like isoform X6 [Lineus longissimus]|uniref:pro-neuregulin-1, membrane-bound isoform-like isoform X6 n=1 Tax=Lineus longissimus TaxID=88925 RepID=UPI00315C520B